MNKVDIILNNLEAMQHERILELILGSQCDSCGQRSLKGTTKSFNEGEDQVLELFYCLECAPE